MLNMSVVNLWPLLAILAVVIAGTNGQGTSTNVGDVTIIPEISRPNENVTLRCTFNLPEDETEVLYWNDKRGYTLYSYRKPNSTVVGPYYKDHISNIKTDAGNHSMILRVTGCNNSPYRCHILTSSSEVILEKSVVIKSIPRPSVYIDDDIVSVPYEIPENRCYNISCKVPEATIKHNLTMEVKINGNSPWILYHQVSKYNPTSCLHSSSLQKRYCKPASVMCTAHYKDQVTDMTHTQTPVAATTTTIKTTTTTTTMTTTTTTRKPARKSNEMQCQSMSIWVLLGLWLFLYLA